MYLMTQMYDLYDTNLCHTSHFPKLTFDKMYLFENTHKETLQKLKTITSTIRYCREVSSVQFSSVQFSQVSSRFCKLALFCDRRQVQVESLGRQSSQLNVKMSRLVNHGQLSE